MTTVGATSQGQQPQTQQSDLQQNQNTTQIKNSDKKTTDVDQKEEEKKPEINESNTNLIINYLPPEMDENALASLLKPFGQYENLKIVIDLQSGKSRGYGFVKYSNSETAKKVIEGLNGQSHGNKKLKVTYARPQCKEIQNANLYVTNVPAHFTETELKDLFAPIGHVVECRVLKDASTSKNVGYVRMNTHAEAENAIKLRDNHIIEEGLEPLSVKFAQRRTSKNNNRGWNNNNDNNDNNNYNNFNNNNNYNNNYNYNNNNNPNFNRQNRPQNFNNINNNRRPNRGGGNRVGSPYRQSQGPMDGMQNMQQQFNNNRGSRDSPFRGGGGRGRSQGRQYRQRNDRSNQNAGPGLYMYDQFQGPPSNMQPFYQGQPSGLPMGPNNQMLAQQQFNSNNTRQTFNIIAYNIPPKYTVDHLIQVYAPYGPIHSVNIVPNSPKGSYGIISYFFYDDAQRAQNETNGRRIENTRLDVVFQK